MEQRPASQPRAVREFWRGRRAHRGIRAALGAAGNRVEFVRLSARTAWKARPRVAVVMHTCIAPPSLMLRTARMTGPYLLVLHGIEAWTRVKPSVRAAARGAWRIVATTWHTAREFAKANGIPENKFV